MVENWESLQSLEHLKIKITFWRRVFLTHWLFAVFQNIALVTLSLDI